MLPDTIAIHGLGKEPHILVYLKSNEWNYHKIYIKYHSDSERGNLLPPLHGLLFLIINKVSFIYHPRDRRIHITAFVTSVVEHWLEREIA